MADVGMHANTVHPLHQIPSLFSPSSRSLSLSLSLARAHALLLSLALSRSQKHKEALVNESVHIYMC